ncbi:MAG: hypothetical protein VX185_05025 [Pseudomonadota bacterium]|nr:hypothetical protein [Pseudomonadota bacterium]
MKTLLFFISTFLMCPLLVAKPVQVKSNDLHTRLNEYYEQITSELKKYPEDKGYQVISDFHKLWRSYRDLCKDESCFFDMDALQLSTLYLNHVSMDGTYSSFVDFDQGQWLALVLKSYGIKRGVSFGKSVELLKTQGWRLVLVEDDRVTENGIFCGSGWQAMCHASFKGESQTLSLVVMNINGEWLVDTNLGGFYSQ